MKRGWAQKGMTLVEVLVATFVIVVAVVALMAGFLSGLLLVESGKNMAVAAADARAVFEEMRRLSASGLPSVAGRNWTTWSRNAGLTGLTNENVTVNFRNPAADPLEATVRVNWTQRDRNRSFTFTGLVTQR